MSSRLNKYVNSDYVSAAQRLRGSGQRRKIVAYVESYDDIFFWRTLLSELETDKIYFEVMLPSRTSLKKGKKTALLHALSPGLGRDMIVCVDADYDYLLADKSNGNALCHGSNVEKPSLRCAKNGSKGYVFHTYAYAIENFQCYAPSLHGVCVMATLNDDHSIFDFETFLAEYSRIIYPLFVWNVWAYRYGRFKEFSMADEDEGLGLDDGGDAPAASSKGGKGLLIPGLLKWVAIGLAAIILIVTVVVITMKVVGGNSTGTNAAIPMTEEYTASKEILDWYTSLGLIQTRTMEANPASVRVDVVLGYKKEDKATSTEITQRTVELKDFLRRYFTQKTADELRPQNEENLKIEIRNAINDTILSSSKIKDVRFMQMDVIQSN